MKTKASTDRLVAHLLLAAVLIVNAAFLAPEIRIARVDLNDNVMHYRLVVGVVRAIERGDNPFDWWAPEWSFGYPVLRTYQPLAHMIVAAIYFALFKSVSLMTVFVWVRYLAVALLPLTFFITARLLSLDPLTSAAAAILSPLISTPGLYGIEYGSYLWRGWGLFTQSVGCHFALLTLGLAWRAIRRGRLLALTGTLLGLTFLSHFVYGYIAALTICLLALLPDRDVPRMTRIARTAAVGLVALLVSAFELLPLWLDGDLINHSRWEPAWKWNSFGAKEALKLFFTGDLLDHGRLPVLTALALAGVALYIRERRKTVVDTFLVSGAALWMLMLFGRPFWGRMLLLVGVPPDMPLHRVIGGEQIFLVLIAATALSAMWRWLRARAHVAAAAVVIAAVLFPMLREREQVLADDHHRGYASLAAYQAERPAIDTAMTIARERGGRAYAGLANGWGGTFTIGAPKIFDDLSEAGIPALSFLYHSMSLSSEVMLRFDESNAAQYRLFDVRTVIAPSNGSVKLPAFLTRVRTAGPLAIYAAPGAGHFDVVDAPVSVETSRKNFYSVNESWLQSDWVEKRQHLLLDFHHDASSATEPLPRLAELPPPGEVLAERRQGEAYQAEVQATRPSYVLFKETWYPNWKALVDGQPARTVMLSPGFLGVPVEPGRHRVFLEYRPEKWRAILAAAGIMMAVLLAALETRSRFR